MTFRSDSYSWMVQKIILPVGDLLLGTRFIRELEKWRKIQWYNSNQLEEYERERLAKLLIHATNKVEYYKNLGLNPIPEDPVQWLSSFPILHKKNIKGQESKFIFGEPSKLVKETSSGSSGIQGEVYMSKVEASTSQAIQTMLWEWSGYRLGDPLLQLGITPHRNFIKRIKDLMLRTNYQQAFDIDHSQVDRALKRITSGTSYFGGYASGLYTYALLASKPPSFKSIISWGDKMFDHYRKNIESTFNSKVYDTYGCTEGFVIAGQCEEGSYHILSPHVKLELVDDNGIEVGVGELGRVVVTRLDGFSMPLIRYYLGDLAVKENPEMKCKCGRSLPILKRIVGRDTDIVKTKSGKVLIVHFFTGILEHFPAIRQFRIVQQNREGFILEYIPEQALFREEILTEIKEIMESKINEPMDINFVKVDVILPTSSGKPQIIKSLLKT